MGRAWDRSGIAFSVEVWREALRVLKPGGYLLAFGGARTYHRMVVAIEDAGFVILPMIGWIYGSGFPKAADVGKGIDRESGAEREKISGGKGPAYQRSIGNHRPWMDEVDHKIDGPTPSTPEAAKWDGWKYSISPLKPALEPICMAQKPCDGRPLASIQRHEVGAVNVDGCRVPTGGRPARGNHSGENGSMFQMGSGWAMGQTEQGRFPPNLCLSPEAARVVGMQSGESHHDEHIIHAKAKGTGRAKGYDLPNETYAYGDSGTAARFFPTFDHYPEPPFLYCGKAGRGEREAGLREAGVGALRDGGRLETLAANHHPTVKPIALMRWLIRLVTRENQTVLDPFTGSGSTGCAAVLERRAFIGIEREPEYVTIANARIKYWAELPQQMPLFAEEER